MTDPTTLRLLANHVLEPFAATGLEITLAIACGTLIAAAGLALLWWMTQALPQRSHPALTVAFGTTLRLGLTVAALLLLANNVPPLALLCGCLSLLVTRAIILVRVGQVR